MLAAVAALALALGALIGVLMLPDGEPPAPRDAGATSKKRTPGAAPLSPSATSAAGTPRQSTGPTPPRVRTEDERSARRVAQRAMDALSQRDTELAKRLSCDPDTVRDGVLAEIPEGTAFALDDAVSVTGDRAVVPFTLTYKGQDRHDEVHLARDGDGWCVVG